MKTVQFSLPFHTFFTHFSHEFHTHISHASEILRSKIYMKRVWNDVNPFTHIFTNTSHGVSHRLSHVKLHWMAKEFHMLLTCKFTHIFTYTSNGVSHGLSDAFNPHWMAKDLEFHMLLIHTYFHTHFTWVSHELWHVNPQWSWMAVEFHMLLHTNCLCCFTHNYSVNQLDRFTHKFTLAIKIFWCTVNCMHIVVYTYSHKQFQVYILICWLYIWYFQKNLIYIELVKSEKYTG